MITVTREMIFLWMQCSILISHAFLAIDLVLVIKNPFYPKNWRVIKIYAPVSILVGAIFASLALFIMLAISLILFTFEYSTYTYMLLGEDYRRKNPDKSEKDAKCHAVGLTLMISCQLILATVFNALSILKSDQVMDR